MLTQDDVTAAHKRIADLQQEVADLPMLMQKAAQAGNTVMVRQLKQRQLDLPDDISAAGEAIIVAELGYVETQIEERKGPEAKAKVEVEALQRERDRILAACAQAEQKYQGLWTKTLGLTVERKQLEKKLAAYRSSRLAELTGAAQSTPLNTAEHNARHLVPTLAYIP